MALSEHRRVLITVLTYPHPSKRYTETVCTAGITEDGHWVRLYPVPLRALPPEKQLHKWHWTELETLHPGQDVRPESRKPIIDTIQITERLDPQRDREERRRLVNQLPVKTLAQWQAGYDVDRTSLGVIVPKRMIALEVEDEDENWSEEQKATLSQLNLFADTPRKLEKIPYRFRYHFEDQDGTEHKLSIRDWELGVLYLKMRDKFGADGAVEKVRQKYFDQMCAPDKDTRLFIGTMYPYNQWMVIGVFWPPKKADAIQNSLFGD